MKNWGNLLLIIISMIVLLQNMPVEVDSQGDEPHAFYFIQQWLPSYCNQEGTPCCYPTTGKPGANFTIYGLWPYNDNGASLENCPGASFDVGPLKAIESMLEQEWPTFTCPQIGRKFWLHEWNKHGACSKSVFQEIQYFEAALNLKNKFNILQILGKANIYPDNEFYPIKTIKDVLFQATGLQPLIYCNRDAEENSQIWQILMCVDKTGMELVNCSNVSDGQRECTSTIKFPSF